MCECVQCCKREHTFNDNHVIISVVADGFEGACMSENLRTRFAALFLLHQVKSQPASERHIVGILTCMSDLERLIACKPVADSMKE